MKLGMMLEVDETFTTNEYMTCKVIRGQGQGQEMISVPFRDCFYRRVPHNLFPAFPKCVVVARCNAEGRSWTTYRFTWV